MEARRASVEVEYEGVDITADLTPDLLSFSYTDNASGNADDASLSINDAKRKWIDKWMFEKGDQFNATILVSNWKAEGDQARMPCGNFLVDEPGYKGRPSVISLKGVSTPSNSNFMFVKRSKLWKGVTLKGIAQEIATRYGLQLFFDSPTNPSYAKREQTDTPDATFLQEACEAEGFGLKLTDRKIIMFGEEHYEKKAPVATYKEWDDIVTDYDFRTRTANTKYAGVSVKYYDPDKEIMLEYLFTNGNDPDEGKIYKVNKKVDSVAEAMRLAKSTLRKLNKRETECSITIVFDARIAAASTIQLEGFGSFSGKYFIDRAAYSVGSGTTIQLEAHKVLEGY